MTLPLADTSVAPASALVGRVLGGKYRLARLLGEGGMGAVFEAEHTGLGKRVAVKLLRGALVRQPQLIERFRREARLAGGIESEHIVQVFDVGADPQLGLYMVMELLRGCDLAELLRQRGRLDPRTAAGLVCEVASALGVAHAARVIHRDIKPANVFLARRADGSSLVKVVDFGIAKLLRDSRGAAPATLTRAGAVVGTPQYMSPEQAQGLSEIDARTDVYSLGLVLYELLTGRSAVDISGTYEQLILRIVTTPVPAPSQAVPGLPAGLDALVGAMTEKTPAARLPSMEAVVERLRSIFPGLPG